MRRLLAALPMPLLLAFPGCVGDLDLSRLDAGRGDDAPLDDLGAGDADGPDGDAPLDDSGAGDVDGPDDDAPLDELEAGDAEAEAGADADADTEADGGDEAGDEEEDDGEIGTEDVPEEDAAPPCGNGLPDSGEECDDGNAEDGDGCDADCTFSCHEAATDCDDGLECTSDTCEAVAGGQACRHALDDGFCLIAGACHADGASDPENDCQVCSVPVATEAWTPRPDFTACSLVTSPDRSYDVCADGTCVSPGCGAASCNAPGPDFPLADTNQRACYDLLAVVSPCPGTAGVPGCGTTLFCGQDAQYGWDTSHAAEDRFVRTVPPTGEAVVADQATGLVWQGCPGGRMGDGCSVGSVQELSWSGAVDYCETLYWNGFDDWRLPGLLELQSLVDYGRGTLLIDTTAFPNTPRYAFWSSSTSASDGGAAWYVYFGLGHTAAEQKYLASEHYARCVRGTLVPLPGPRFGRTEPVPEQPVVADAATGLVWQGCAAGLRGASCAGGSRSHLAWGSALTYCEDLLWGGADDWRLPDLKELSSVVDDRRARPATSPAAFPATPAESFWTSSSDASAPSRAWAVSFDAGSYNMWPKSDSDAVRCVRGGP